MWEIAFHNLSRLEFRQAYVMIKGILEYPLKINTLDTPFARPDPFVYSEKYLSLDVLEKQFKARKQVIEEELRTLLEIPVAVPTETVAAPADLGFLEGKPPEGERQFVVVHQETVTATAKIENLDFLSAKPPETGEGSLPPVDGNKTRLVRTLPRTTERPLKIQCAKPPVLECTKCVGEWAGVPSVIVWLCRLTVKRRLLSVVPSHRQNSLVSTGGSVIQF